MKPRIRLYDAVGTGLIIIYPTGLIVSNQTDGSACMQSCEEGFYLPIANDYLLETDQLSGPEKELANYFSQQYPELALPEALMMQMRLQLKLYLINIIYAELLKLTGVS